MSLSSESKDHILVVEDEVKIANLLRDYLENSGYRVTVLNDGFSAVDVIRLEQPNCALLDLMLPGKSGLDICRETRQFSDIPIVMITARVDEIDRLLGLELGADDYICKPFSPREVVVRVRNILRRINKGGATTTSSNDSSGDLVYRGLRLNQEYFRCELNDQPIALTAVEFRMLFSMASQVGRIFSRDQLMNFAYTDDRVVSDRTIDTHIKNMRKKLVNSPQENIIHSIYGVGYKVE